MNYYIKLYYNELDINPAYLLKHFLPYLGFYVENGINNNNIKPLINICIISKEFVENNSEYLDCLDESNTIFILKDDYIIDAWYKQITYTDEESKEFFLSNLIDKIYSVLSNSYYDIEQPIFLNYNWKNEAKFVANQFIKNDIFKQNTFAKILTDDSQIYNNCITKYINFINSINKQMNLSNSDYLRYALINAKYEINLISHQNSYKYPFNPQGMINDCNLLLDKYNFNEMLHLLRADTSYKLHGDWMYGGDRYQDKEISHCIYKNPPFSKIVFDYYGEYNIVIDYLKDAILTYPYYYEGLLPLSQCYRQTQDFQDALKCLNRIKKILSNKFNNKMLSPKEFIYLYKSIINSAIIYKLNYYDYNNAYTHSDISNQVLESNCIENYMNVLWKNEPDLNEIKDKTYKKIKKDYYIDIDALY